MKHHDDAIARYVERVSTQASVLAVVITGSIVRGTERPDSDIDLYLVVTEEAWDTAWLHHRLMYTETEGIGYEGGYFDVKLATLSYLDDAAERGDDPVRDSFAHSSIAFSRVDDLADRLERAARVPDEQWMSRAASFLAQVRLHGGYFLDNAYRASDNLLLQHAAVHAVVAADRALLALNHVTFQGQKYLTKTTAVLERKPHGWQQLVDDLLSAPSPTTSGALTAALEEFYDWPLPREQTLSRFIVDNELAWRYRTPNPEYS
ncbi:MAG: hypothetical protein JWQ12_1348 [Glaciihabitans sp.]|nr:hypothetical protein [Glaciihabitans sp.]